jgi:hypothetical protein
MEDSGDIILYQNSSKYLLLVVHIWHTNLCIRAHEIFAIRWKLKFSFPLMIVETH